jgi:hypothetical protein
MLHKANMGVIFLQHVHQNIYQTVYNSLCTQFFPPSLRADFFSTATMTAFGHNTFWSWCSSQTLAAPCWPRLLCLSIWFRMVYFKHIFGSRLIVLNKRSGDVRPVAIGCTWRRLIAKCANAFACNEFVGLFGVRQVGVAVKDGCEAAVYAACRYMENISPDNAVAKLDFYNAFNCLDRGCMRDKVAEVIPEYTNFAVCRTASRPRCSSAITLSLQRLAR